MFSQEILDSSRSLSRPSHARILLALEGSHFRFVCSCHDHPLHCAVLLRRLVYIGQDPNVCILWVRSAGALYHRLTCRALCLVAERGKGMTLMTKKESNGTGGPPVVPSTDTIPLIIIIIIIIEFYSNLLKTSSEEVFYLLQATLAP
jgi:hypothetical protein